MSLALAQCQGGGALEGLYPTHNNLYTSGRTKQVKKKMPLFPKMP
jgi:hypothetical protein